MRLRKSKPDFSASRLIPEPLLSTVMLHCERAVPPILGFMYIRSGLLLLSP